MMTAIASVYQETTPIPSGILLSEIARTDRMHLQLQVISLMETQSMKNKRLRGFHPSGCAHSGVLKKKAGNILYFLLFAFSHFRHFFIEPD